MLPIYSQSINFIYKNDTWSKLTSQIKNLTQILLTFSIVLTHNLLLRNVHQRQVDLLSNDLSRSCLTSSRRTFKQNSLRSTAIFPNPSCFGDLLVNLRMSQVKQNRIFNLSLLILVTSNVFPRDISKFIIPGLDHSNPELLKLMNCFTNSSQKLLSFLLNLIINSFLF